MVFAGAMLRGELNCHNELNDAFVVITVMNNTGDDVVLDGFHFDARRRYQAPGADGWILEIADTR